MPRSTWLNILIILLVIIAASYVAQVLIGFLSGFSDIILILVLAWLVAYALSPLVDLLNERPLPKPLSRAAGADRGTALGKRLAAFRISRPLAVALVYLGLVLVVIIMVASLIPAIVTQVDTIAPELSKIDVAQLALTDMFQEVLRQLNIAVNIQNLIDNAFASVQALATPILQNTVAILTSVLSLLGNALLVILLSFFLTLDGPRFGKMLYEVIPERLHQETRMFIITTDRAFGGFLRSQLLQSAAIGIGTGLVLGAFGIQAALLAGVFAGLFMIIPLVGPPLSLLPPLLAVLLADPDKILLVMLPLVVLQVVVVNMLMPRIMGDALGLHPLVIIVSLLIGVKVGGFWGAFFAMPLAGIISAFGAFLIRRRQRLTEWTASIVQQDDTGALLVPDQAQSNGEPVATSAQTTQDRA
ncbi:MAG: AI-2E family transporter [Chloroflexi bacterium]|nr:AI-2E family transporter [Chloroflexota bacterium]